jgi:hypothetical protein
MSEDKWIDTPGLRNLLDKDVPDAAKCLTTPEVYKPILIVGPTGCGKSFIKDRILRKSGIDPERTPVINCANLTETFLETELFGHVKGAFTGAVTSKKGLLELGFKALVFDEIGMLSDYLQSKLLTFFESGMYRKVGSVKDSKSETKIVAMTNVELESLKLRQDLIYRCKVITIEGLYARRQDVITLLHHFAPNVRWTRSDLLRLLTYHWPGNIRQLRDLALEAEGHSEEILNHKGPWAGVLTWFNYYSLVLGSSRFSPNMGFNALAPYLKNLPRCLFDPKLDQEIREFCPHLSFLEAEMGDWIDLEALDERKPGSVQQLTPHEQDLGVEWFLWCVLFRQKAGQKEDIFDSIAQSHPTSRRLKYRTQFMCDQHKERRFTNLCDKIDELLYSKTPGQDIAIGVSDQHLESGKSNLTAIIERERAFEVVADIMEPREYERRWTERCIQRGMKASEVAKKYSMNRDTVKTKFRRYKS